MRNILKRMVEDYREKSSPDKYKDETLGEFLKRRDALNIFIANYVAYRRESELEFEKTLRTLLSSEKPSAFGTAFIWKRTPEGKKYWFRMDRAWNRLKKIKQGTL